MTLAWRPICWASEGRQATVRSRGQIVRHVPAERFREPGGSRADHGSGHRPSVRRLWRQRILPHTARQSAGLRQSRGFDLLIGPIPGPIWLIDGGFGRVSGGISLIGGGSVWAIGR